MIKTTMRMVIMAMMMMIGGSLGGAVAVAEADKVTPPCRGCYSTLPRMPRYYKQMPRFALQKDATLK